MKNRLLLAVFAIPVLVMVTSAQRPDNAPATQAAGKPPDSVFIEDLTWAEVRDLIASGTTNVIIGTAGTEQKGPHMVDGEHKFVMEWSADKIARLMGKTLVAPVVAYVPEGSWENIGGHMAKPGTITLPDDRFTELLFNAGKSLKAGGFKNIWYIGESGGNRNGMRAAAEKLNALWNGSAKAYWVDDYYTKAHAQQNTMMAKLLKVGDTEVGNHANVLDTSELLFVNPKMVRRDRLTGNDYPNNGVQGGNQSKATPEIGKQLLQMKLDLAMAQIKQMQSGSEPPVPAAGGAGGADGPPQGGRGGAAAQGGRGAQAAQQPRASLEPTMNTAPAGITPTKAPDTLFIDELTWEETRDAMKSGKTVFIVPTGGTEKNGYQMVIGKHNFIVRYTADQIARRL
ncbi:MAG: creatininase family protein, partial [Acidobacteriota bacterium]